MGLVAMSDYLDMDTSLEAGLLLSNYSSSDFAVIAKKAEAGFNITLADIFGIVRVQFHPSTLCFSSDGSLVYRAIS